MGNWRAGYIERCPSGSGRRETVSVHDSTVKLTPLSWRCQMAKAPWRMPARLWVSLRHGLRIFLSGQTVMSAPTIERTKSYLFCRHYVWYCTLLCALIRANMSSVINHKEDNIMIVYENGKPRYFDKHGKEITVFAKM